MYPRLLPCHGAGCLKAGRLHLVIHKPFQDRVYRNASLVLIKDPLHDRRLIRLDDERSLLSGCPVAEGYILSPQGVQHILVALLPGTIPQRRLVPWILCGLENARRGCLADAALPEDADGFIVFRCMLPVFDSLHMVVQPPELDRRDHRVFLLCDKQLLCLVSECVFPNGDPPYHIHVQTVVGIHQGLIRQRPVHSKSPAGVLSLTEQELCLLRPRFPAPEGLAAVRAFQKSGIRVLFFDLP